MENDQSKHSSTGRTKSVQLSFTGLVLVWLAIELGFTWLGIPAGAVLMLAWAAFSAAYGEWSPENKAELDRKAAQAAFVRSKEFEESKARAAKKKRQQTFLDDLERACGHAPVVGTVLSRGGYPLAQDSAVVLTCRPGSLHLSSLAECSDFAIDLKRVEKLEISGPGKTVTGGGIVGGGLGIQAAAEGILIASVLNTLTTRTTNETYWPLVVSCGKRHSQ